MEKYDSFKLEQAIRTNWKKIDLAKKLKALRKGEKTFYLLDGPPYVNAHPHMGHLKTTTCKDIWSKLKLMQGFDSWLQPGFDCHGLPIENKVEKDLNLKSKKDIEKLGTRKFISLCLDKVLDNESHWLKIYKLLGSWRGFYEPYFTYKPYYIESAWWTLKEMHKNGLLKKGKLAIHWCPRCETALAGYEVSDSYKNVTDTTIYVKFKIKDQKDTYLIAYTTTPWTLPGNVALAVAPKENYVKVETNGEFYILAEALIEKVAKLANFKYKIIEKFLGETLDGIKYEPILNVPSQKMSDRAHKIYLSVPIMKFKKYKKHETGASDKEEFDQFVTVNDGTGIVHSAPGHGSSDNFFGKHYNLDAVSPVNESGRFTSDAGKYEGMFVKDADKIIIQDLKDQNKLLYTGHVTHSYPLCWRCKSPLIFRLSKQWYLSVDPIKEQMIKSNDKVNWMPSFGKKRFENWLIERTDWCVSQQRYWGTPLPIWECECGKIHIFGSLKELQKKAIDFPKDITDLHKDTVDKIKIRCNCNREVSRIPDISNVWFDSGIAPWASLGYPHKNKELFEKLYPCDLVVESQDQIRGWFDSMMFTSIGTFKKQSYKSVGLMGWVLDEKGIKMSKSVGNVIWAEDGLKDLGADAIRLYYCWEVAPWEVQKFSTRICGEVKRNLNILWNLHEFYKTYCKITPSKSSPRGIDNTSSSKNGSMELQKNADTPAIEDKWLISKMNSVIEDYTNHLEKFEFRLAGRTIMDFIINDFSRWYVKLIRNRLNEPAVSTTFNYCLEKCIKLLAPVTPFITEKIYLESFYNINSSQNSQRAKESIHLEDFPKSDKKLINKKLEGNMKILMNIVEASNSLRLEKKIRLKYPLQTLIVNGEKDTLIPVKCIPDLLKLMANVKEIKTNEHASSYSVKLNFKSAGKKFGKDVKEVAKLIVKSDANKLKIDIDKGELKIEKFSLNKDDLIFTSEYKGDGKQFDGGFVELDTTVSPKLKKEWLERELIRAIQTARKELNLSIKDKIIVYLPKELKEFENEERKVGPKDKKFSFEFEGKKYDFGVEKA